MLRLFRRYGTTVAQAIERPTIPKLRHIEITRGPKDIVPLDLAMSAQDNLIEKVLRFRKLQDKITSNVLKEEVEEIPSSAISHKSNEYGRGVTNQIPPPAVLSFTPFPVYATGRRVREVVKPSLEYAMMKPLALKDGVIYSPTVVQTRRGGLTTYHGPGQVVLFPILDMRYPLFRSMGPRRFVCALEKATISALQDFSIHGQSDPDAPGVWVEVSKSKPARKIAALGVHFDRGVSSFGVSINIDMDTTGPAETNPWARFTPCGLEGREPISMSEVLRGKFDADEAWAIPRVWAEHFAQQIGLEEVEHGEQRSFT